jgi:hypothetical protein
MPYKSGSMKGELTTPELRQLIKAHNVLMSIVIPKGAKRDDIIKLINSNGYDINHKEKKLVPRVKMKRKPVVSMKSVEKTKPKPKTKEEKDEMVKNQKERVIQYIIQNKDILDDERIKNL